MRAADLDRLRDKMCVELLEATSSDTALQRYRLEVKMDYPAYDPDPASNLRRLAPRDVIKRCPCGRLFVEQHAGGHEMRYCRKACRDADNQRAWRARQAAGGA